MPDDGMPDEANRPDGAPAREPPQEAPSAEEAKAEARRHLAAEGCTECGEDDPGVLQAVSPLLPSCSVVQRQYREVVYCDDCLDARDSLREQALQSAREKDTDAVVFYECENISLETFEREPRLGVETATVGLHCRCGARVEEVVYLDGDE